MTIAKRRIGRGWLLAIAGAAIIGMFAVGGALAVHNEGFQLEGNATAADTSYGASTSGPAIHPAGDLCLPVPTVFCGPEDWNQLFNINGTPAPGNAEGTVTGAKTFPRFAGDTFTAADFQKDFRNDGTTYLTWDSTTFATGSKDTLDVSGWQCNKDNNVNNKIDIMNGFAAIQEKDGQKYFYYGLEKNVDNGDNNIALWLFQDPTVGCDSANPTDPVTYSTKTFTGQHRDGDLLIVSAFTNGGGVSNISIYEWLSGALSPIPPGGIDCLVTTEDDKACATVNEKPVRMPWLTADGSNPKAPDVNDQHPSPNFFEGGINLTAFPQFEDKCFSKYLLDTRSSQSLTATLFDYVLGDISTCRPDLSLVKTPDGGNHFVGDSFDWTIVVTNNGNGNADDAVVTDSIPAGLTINSATTPAGVCTIDGQDVECTIDVAAEGGTATITVNVTSTLDVFGASEDGCIRVDNEATVTGDVDTSDNTDDGYVYVCRPLVSKTGAGAYDERHEWTVEKTVDPLSQSGFAGETVYFDWTITVDETVTEENFAVTGVITVVNPNPDDPMTVSLADVLDVAGAVTITADADCDFAAGSLTIPADSTATCGYSAAPGNRDATLNTATVTLNSIDFTGTAPIAWTANVIRGSATLDDDQFPYSGQAVSDGWTNTYEDSYTCSSDENDYTDGADLGNEVSNTADVYSGAVLQDSSTATTEIDCYRLSVSKDATTSYDRDYTWDIEKSADESEINLSAGGTATVNYTVTVTASPPNDSNHAVSGNITIVNPAPMAADITDITDTISGGVGEIAVDCGGATSVPAEDSIVCTYSSSLPDGSSLENSVDVVAYGVTYNATAPIVFGDPTTTTDECVDVNDTLQGFLGTVCAGDSPHSFNYSRQIGPYAACGDYTVDNTADFVTNDTGTTGSSSWSVLVHVIGCGNLFHTGTTCGQYYLGEPAVGLAGTAIDFVNYSVRSNKISQVDPGVFFYYTTLTATGGSITAKINQIEPATYNHPMAINQDNTEIRVFDANCNPITSFTYTVVNGDVNLLVNGTTVGADYIVSVKYNPKNLVGLVKPATSPVTYTWQTEVGLVISNQDSLDLRRK